MARLPKKLYDLTIWRYLRSPKLQSRNDSSIEPSNYDSPYNRRARRFSLPASESAIGLEKKVSKDSV